MAKIPISDAIRIIPRDDQFLNRKLGSRGEIFYDRDANTLRIYDGLTTGGTNLARSDLENVSNADFLSKANAAGISGAGGSFELTIAGDDSTTRTITSGNVLQFTGSSGISTTATVDGEILITNTQPNFSTITVAGQTSVTAGAPSSTLSLVAGNNITLTTNGNAISIAAASGLSSNSFSTIVIAGQSSVVADSSTDTLTLLAGTGITLVTNATTDTITINNVAERGAIAFTELNDSAGLTVDRFYLPAITMLTVSNSGAAAYRFDQYGSFDNPTIYAINGTTIAFRLTATGHPFLIQNSAGVSYSTGLFHVSTTGDVSTGASAQGKDSGTLYWKIPTDISGGYRYQCGVHAPMVGLISIKLFSGI
jgi:plastocyanin